MASFASSTREFNCKYKMNNTEMKHYKSSEWGFALDIPRRWNSFPPVPTNNPYEVIRFASREDGIHAIIIFREPYDPKQTLKQHSDQIKRILTSKGFGNFVTAETKIKSRAALILDFDRAHEEANLPIILVGERYVLRPERRWSCRHYFIARGTLAYTLGFGTTNKAGMFKLFDRIAKSFEAQTE